MKRSVIILLILFLPIISAVTLDMKTEFDKGETFMAKVSGNFFESIVKEDILFYERHIREPMSPFVIKINNNFYIYAQLFGKPQNNYSIVIKDVKYIEGGLIVQEDITKFFSISNNIAAFSIEPGFVFTNGNFFIEVENLQDSEINIEVVTSSINLETTEPINLGTGATKRIYFSIENLTEPTFEIIKLVSENLQYNVPVYIFGVSEGEPGCVANNSCEDNTCVGNICTDSCGNVYDGIKICVDENNTCISLEGICEFYPCSQGLQDLGKLDCGFFRTCCKSNENHIKENISEDEKKSFNFEQSELEIVMPTNSYTIREIYLYNTGEKTIEDISLLISGELKNYITLSTDKIDKLEPDSNVKIELEFYSFDKAIEVDGELVAKEQDISTYSSIFLTMINNYIPLDEYEYSPSVQTKTCAELNGVVCSLDEECDTDYVYAKDNKCCLGTCGGEEPSSTGKIIGWAIVGIVVVFLIWFFKTKYKGAKKPPSLLDIAKGKK